MVVGVMRRILLPQGAVVCAVCAAVAVGAGKTVSFNTPRAYPVGNSPQSVSVGDFNGDGKQDLAVANFTSNTVSILLGRGDGTFQRAVNYSAGSNPQSVAVSDFNGDGKQDLAVINNGSNTVSILLGRGDGTFQPAVTYSAGSGPSSIAVADFNKDGKLDLAVADLGFPNYWGNTISILLGNGDGTFQAAVSYQVGFIRSTWPLATSTATESLILR